MCVCLCVCARESVCSTPAASVDAYTHTQGARTAVGMAQGAMQLLSEQVMGKLGAGKKPSGSSGGSKSGGGKGGGASQVVTLNSADFKSKVMESKDDWLIAFTAPWCGHCVKLQPEWEDAAKQLKGDFKLGWVDATQ